MEAVREYPFRVRQESGEVTLFYSNNFSHNFGMCFEESRNKGMHTTICLNENLPVGRHSHVEG